MMSASKNDYPHSPQPQGKPQTLAKSSFSGQARLRELEHLADTARKIRDQAAAELTRGSGAAHHIARERISIAERMLRKTQIEITELRTQLAELGGPNPDAAEPAVSAKDNELAVMLGYSKTRFNLAGDTPFPLELQQQHSSSRSYAAARNSTPVGSRKNAPGAPIVGILLILALGISAIGLGVLTILK